MPLSFLYYYVAEQWRLVQKKMAAAKNIYPDRPRIILASNGKIADLSLCPNAISEKPAYA